MVRIAFAAGLLIAAASAAGADELAPMRGHSVVLGPLQGIAYYTNEPEGDRIVATLVDPDRGTPMRVTATLLPGQHLVLSVPRGVGEPAIEVVFRRQGSRVFVSDTVALTN